MPIQLNCPCGKQLRVPEEHAGKRVKCTGCGQILAVPSAQNAVKQPVAVKTAARPAVPAPARPSSPAPIVTACDECGRTIKARLEHVGKKVKCPDCGAPVLITDPEEDGVEEITEKRPAPSRVAAGKPSSSRPKPIVEEEEVSEDDEAAEEEERPRKRKKGKKGKKAAASSQTMLWVGIGSGAAVLLGGVVFALFWFLGGSSKNTDVAKNTSQDEGVVFTGEKALLASGPAGFVVMQVGELSKTPLGQEFTKKVMADQSPDNPLLLLESVGLKPADILHVGFAMKEFSNATGPSGLLYFTTANPMDQNKLIQAAQLNADAKTHQGANYYLDTAHGNAMWHFATPTMLVIAKDEPMIKEAIDRLAGRQKSTAKIMAKAIDQIDNHHVVSAFVLPAELRGGGGPQMPPGGMQRPGGAGMQGGPGGMPPGPGGAGIQGGPGGGIQKPPPPGRPQGGPGGGQRPGGRGMQGGPGMPGGPGGMPAAQSPLGKFGELQLGMVTVDVTGNTVATETTCTFPGEQSAKDALAFLTEQKESAKGLLLFAPKPVGDAFNTATMTQSGNQVTIKAAIEITADLMKQAFPERGGPGGRGEPVPRPGKKVLPPD